MIEFIECTSLNISYNTMGIATISYTVVHDVPEFITYPGSKSSSSITFSAGGQTFTGHVINASLNQIPNTEGWYETHVTLLATTN